jgi:hypothetical protein
VLAAVNLTALLPGSPVHVVRRYMVEKESGELLLQHTISLPTSAPVAVELGSVEVAMVFDQLFTGACVNVCLNILCDTALMNSHGNSACDPLPPPLLFCSLLYGVTLDFHIRAGATADSRAVLLHRSCHRGWCRVCVTTCTTEIIANYLFEGYQ